MTWTIRDMVRVMKRSKLIFIILAIVIVLLMGGCGSKEKKVICPMCNGTGQVKYYYGEGDNDYNMGPCTTCDEKGFIMIVPTGDSKGGTRVICGSCEKYVDELITKEDVSGENRTWCAECWKDYDKLMGK